MAFIFDAVRPGTGSLHQDHNSASGPQHRRLRKSRTYGDLFSPITRAIRDPVGSLGDILETFTFDEKSRKKRKPEDGGSRRQVLYLRMKEVFLAIDVQLAQTDACIGINL